MSITEYEKKFIRLIAFANGINLLEEAKASML